MIAGLSLLSIRPRTVRLNKDSVRNTDTHGVRMPFSSKYRILFKQSTKETKMVQLPHQNAIEFSCSGVRHKPIE